MNSRVKKWIRKNNTVINVLLIIIGISTYFLGHAYLSNSPIYEELISAIGVEISTNSILLIVSLVYFQDDEEYDKAKKFYDEKGLIGIYTEKNETYEIINRNYLVKKKIRNYDIICCGGLSTLRRAEGRKIIEYAKKNHMKIRILTANPNCEYLLQFKLDEEIQFSDDKQYSISPLDNTIKKDIYALYDWVMKANRELPDEDKIQIKFYNSLPSLQYHRVGSNLFISSRIIGAVSKASPTYEYIDTGNYNDGFNMYSLYFEKLWNDPNFATPSPEVQLNPRLLINDVIINNILKLACVDIAGFLKCQNYNAIRASLTIVGFPKPLEDGKLRRFNTNIARGREIIDINNSNGKIVNGKHIGYYAYDETHVVGKAIKLGRPQFEIIQKDDDCAVLSVPILNGNSEVLAAVNFDFAEELRSEILKDETKSLSEQNAELMNIAKWWMSLVSTYLRIKEDV